jgi:methylated-DNA-[protein]-cysteine S-methyltransferase
MTQPFEAFLESDIGLIEIIGTEAGLISVNFVDDPTGDAAVVHPTLQECVSQLEAYFKGTRRQFELELAPEGTPFQQQVWRELLNIPYGQTVSYLEIARIIDNEKAVRAVGAANGQNPISIIIPCHRVIGANGQLTGYGGGLWRKEWLLNHERNFSIGQQMSLF